MTTYNDIVTAFFKNYEFCVANRDEAYGIAGKVFNTILKRGQFPDKVFEPYQDRCESEKEWNSTVQGATRYNEETGNWEFKATLTIKDSQVVFPTETLELIFLIRITNDGFTISFQGSKVSIDFSSHKFSEENFDPFADRVLGEILQTYSITARPTLLSAEKGRVIGFAAK